jgi:uncharacterized protein YndB with AHSA1/START domain
MVTFEFTVTVDRPVEEVFAYLTDPEKLPEWQSMVLESSKLSEGPVSAGTKMTEVRKFLGRRFESTVEVTQYEANRRFDVKTVSGPIPFSVTQTFTPSDGGTSITVHGEGEPGGFFKLAEPLVGRQAQRQVQNDFSTAKDLLEGEGAS